MKLKFILVSVMLLCFTITVNAQGIEGKIFRKNNELIYTIKPGDTFYKISSKLGVSVDVIRGLNPKIDPKNLQVGSIIRVKQSSKIKSYIVQPGDVLWEISREKQIPVSLMSQANLIADPNFIVPGEVLLLPKQTQTKLYFLKFTSKDAFLISEKRTIIGREIYSNTIRELIKGPKDKKAFMPIPKDTKVIGVQIKDTIAYVNFGQKILRSNVGAGSEFLLLAAITNTLTEFDQIQKVKILVQGDSVETIGGHIILDKPLERSMNVVKNSH